MLRGGGHDGDDGGWREQSLRIMQVYQDSTKSATRKLPSTSKINNPKGLLTHKQLEHSNILIFYTSCEISTQL